MDEKQILREELDRQIRKQIDNKKVDALLVEQQIKKLADLENERYLKTKV
jgi:uncharacterized membrane protein YqiK